MAFKTNTNNSLGNGKVRGNARESGGSVWNGEGGIGKRVRFEQVTEEEQVVQRPVVRISCEVDIVNCEGDGFVTEFRQPSSSSCFSFTSKWRRRKRKRRCHVQ